MNNVKQTVVRDFEADRKICDAATGGSWDVRLWGADWTVTETGIPLAKAISYEDARFIAEARTGWPAALDEIDRLRGVLERFDARTHPMLSRTDMARIAGEALDGDTTRSTYFELRKLRAEIQRYRQALESIAEYPPFSETNNGDRFYEQIRKIAKGALGNGED